MWGQVRLVRVLKAHLCCQGSDTSSVTSCKAKLGGCLHSSATLTQGTARPSRAVKLDRQQGLVLALVRPCSCPTLPVADFECYGSYFHAQI